MVYTGTAETDDETIEAYERFIFLHDLGWSYKSYIETPLRIRKEILFLRNERETFRKEKQKIDLNLKQKWTKTN